MTYSNSLKAVEAAAQIARRQRAERAIDAAQEARARRGMLCAIEGKKLTARDEPWWRVAIVERHRAGTVELVRLADGTKLGREEFGRVMLDSKGEVAHPVLVLERLRAVGALPYRECVAAIKRAAFGEDAGGTEGIR